MKKHKVKGFMTLQSVLMVILLGLLALSFLQIYGSQFSALTANRRALQAQQFAQSEADFLRNVSYDELNTIVHGRQAIAGTSGWMSEVSLSAETTVNEVQQRIGTIKVYRNSSVSAPDFSLQVPLTSQGNGIPIGTIVAYNGDLTKIPRGWALCDGTNGTPDLRDRFLEGVGSFNINTYVDAGLPNITGSIYESECIIKNGQGCFESRTVKYKENNWRVRGNGDGDVLITFSAARSSDVYGKSTTVQPAAYTVYYIIKLK